MKKSKLATASALLMCMGAAHAIPTSYIESVSTGPQSFIFNPVPLTAGSPKGTAHAFALPVSTLPSAH